MEAETKKRAPIIIESTRGEEPAQKPPELSRRRFFTKIENGQAKFISREGQIVKMLLNWDGMEEDGNGDVVPLTGGKKNRIKFLGGFEVFSVHPLDYVEVYDWEWDTVDEHGNKKHHERKNIDYFWLIPDYYYSEIVPDKPENAAAVTKDGVVITKIRLGYLMRPKNPRRARYGITNWVIASAGTLNNQIRDLFGQYTLDELLKGQGDLGKIFLERIITNPIWEIKKEDGSIVKEDRTYVKKDLDGYGTEVSGIQILGIEYPEDVKKAISAPFIAEQAAKEEIKRSEGKKQALINEGQGEELKMKSIANGRLAELQAIADGEEAYIKKLEEKWGKEAALVIYNRSLAANSSLSVRLNEHHISGLEDVLPSGDQIKKELEKHIQTENGGGKEEPPSKPAG